jgi:hypothetical protein
VSQGLGTRNGGFWNTPDVKRKTQHPEVRHCRSAHTLVANCDYFAARQRSCDLSYGNEINGSIAYLVQTGHPPQRTQRKAPVLKKASALLKETNAIV